MQVNIEDVGPCRRKLTVEVPVERVREEFDKSYSTLSDNVDVPGFRRGRAPRWLLEKRFGRTLQDDVREALLASTLTDIAKENELEPLGKPEYEDVEFAPETPLKFKVTIEIKPTFELPEYAQIELSKESRPVTDEDVDKSVETFRKAHGKLVKSDASTTSADSYVMADVRVEAGDADPLTREGAVFGLEDQNLLGLSIPSLGKKLAKAHVGDSRTFDVTVPDDYPVEAMRGAKGTIHVDVKEIQRLEVPDLDEAFLKEAGFESEESFRERLRQSMSARRDQEAQADLDRQLSDTLLEMLQFDLPEKAVAAQAESLVRRRKLDRAREGASEEEVEAQTEELSKDVEADAARSIRLYFILDAVADKEDIQSAEADLEGRVSSMAARWGVRPQQMYVWLERQNLMDDLRQEIRTEKTRRFLIDHATIKEEAGADVKK